jgi:chromosome segregation ATPase
MTRIIDTLKSRVEAHPNIDDDTAADVVAELDADKAAILAAQAKIEALGNSSDVNATKAAAAELRAAWMDARVTIRLTEGLLRTARFEEFLNHLERMETRLKAARDELAGAGKDVTQLDADLATFGAKIDAAATSYAEVKSSYVSAMAEADTEAEANELLKTTKEKIDATHEALKGARADLRAILKDIKSLDGGKLSQIAEAVSADAAASATLETEVSA